MRRVIFAGILLILMSVMQGCGAGIIYQTTEKDLQTALYNETKNKAKKFFYEGSHSIGFRGAPSSIKISEEGFQVIQLENGKQVLCMYDSIGDPFVQDWGQAALDSRFGVHINGCNAQVWFKQKESAIMFAQLLYTLKHQVEEYKVAQNIPSGDTTTGDSKGKAINTDVDTLPLSAIPDNVYSEALDFGDYYALVIGNNDYREIKKLHTAVSDAQAIDALLQDKYGFKTRLLLNATRSDILKAVNDYRRRLGPRDNLLIYYAGHGWLDKDADQGYWLPVDATEQDPTNWISNGSITDSLRAMEAKHVLVIADSCYSGKLSRGVNVKLKTKNYYNKISVKKARTVMASGGLEPVADDGGKGTHSVFASALIEALNENQGVIDTTLLFSQIRRPVMVNADQTPEYSDIHKAGHDGGDFLFVRAKKP